MYLDYNISNMPRKRQSDTGQFQTKVTTKEVLEAVEEFEPPIVTGPMLAEKFDCDRRTIYLKLDELVESGDLETIERNNRTLVWYSSDVGQSTENVILFPERREVIVENASDITRTHLSRLAHLVDSSSDALMYKLRKQDIWQAPHEELSNLLEDLREVLSDQSPHLEEWIEKQWNKAHQFKLRTHSDGFTVLEAKVSDLMEDVAKRKLDGRKHLYRHLSDTESRVVEGKEAEIKKTLYDAGYPVQDERELDSGADLDIDLELDLRDYQEEWRKRFLTAGSGVFVGPSGSGKTVAGMGVMEDIGGETLILVPSRELATQWKEELLDKTTLSKYRIGEYHGGEKNIKPVTIATYQTAGMSRHRELFNEREWGLIIYDEVHHIPAKIYRRSADLQAKHRLGLSATPVREDKKEKEIFTLIGKPIGTDWASLFVEGHVQEPEVEIYYTPWSSDYHRKRYKSASGHKKLQVASKNPKKLKKIEELLESHESQKTLIFVEWLDQGKEYSDQLGIPFLSGETSHDRREELLNEFREGQRTRLIVSRVGDEGIDLPDAETAIVASGLGGSRRQGAQRAGRTMRPSGDSKVYVLATRGSSEEDFAQRQMQHLEEKGVRVSESEI